MSAFADTGSIPPQQIWDGIVGRTIHGERITLSLLERWRAGDDGALRPLLRSIAGIAAALRNTG